MAPVQRVLIGKLARVKQGPLQDEVGYIADQLSSTIFIVKFVLRNPMLPHAWFSEEFILHSDLLDIQPSTFETAAHLIREITTKKPSTS